MDKVYIYICIYIYIYIYIYTVYIYIYILNYIFIEKIILKRGPMTDVKTHSPLWSPPSSLLKSFPHHCWRGSSSCKTPGRSSAHTARPLLIGRSPAVDVPVWGRGFPPHWIRSVLWFVRVSFASTSTSVWGECPQSSCAPRSDWRKWTAATSSSAQPGPGGHVSKVRSTLLKIKVLQKVLQAMP